MILLFSSSDFPSATVTKLSQQLRHRGYLVYLPGKTFSPDLLTAIPFTAALLCYGKKADGLPLPERFREQFPGLRLLVLSEKNPSTQWRSIPGTDDELSAPHDFADICAMLDKAGVFCDATRQTIRRYGIELPPHRHHVLLGIRRFALTPAQYTILRLLILCREPLTEEQLAGFLRKPKGKLPTGSVRVHIHDLNRTAAKGCIPRLIRYVYRTGYQLCPPYGGHLTDNENTDGAPR